MTDVAEQDWVQKERDLTAAKEAIAGPVPLMVNPPECIVELPRGLFIGGEWKTTTEVRELTGADEESLARTRKPADFFDAVIARGVVRIGDYGMADRPTDERRARLQDLLIGERDQIFLKIVQATYGDTKTLNFTCGTCQSEQEVEIILSVDFKIKTVEDPQKTLFTYRTAKDELIEWRPATGADQMEALKRKGSTVAEQNTVMLSRCIVKVNGELPLDPILFARSMSMRDRQGLLTDLVARQPDVDLTLTTKCVVCDADQTLAFGWADLFRL